MIVQAGLFNHYNNSHRRSHHVTLTSPFLLTLQHVLVLRIQLSLRPYRYGFRRQMPACSIVSAALWISEGKDLDEYPARLSVPEMSTPAVSTAETSTSEQEPYWKDYCPSSLEATQRPTRLVWIECSTKQCVGSMLKGQDYQSESNKKVSHKATESRCV